MGKFILGVIVALVLIAAALYVFTQFGFVNLRADVRPSLAEQWLATRAMDAWATRQAPKVSNPLAASDTNLIDGAKLYKSVCATCHGSPLNPAAEVGLALYPRAPQFLKDAPDMPEHEIFYIVRHGVRWTGMPGWGNTLTEAEIWKVVGFLSHLEKLPPAVAAEWKKPMTP